MSEDTAQNSALSTEDVAALRAAEELSFHHNDGDSYIRLYLRSSYSGGMRVFTARQQRLFPDTQAAGAHDRARVIGCDSGVSGYDEPVNHENAACFLAKSASGEPWRTAVGLVRVGDRLKLRWVAGNNNHYLDNAGLFMDELYLVARRGQRELWFALARTVCADNTARMIRRVR